jgi:CHASE2 domain-containing sensor protein
VPRKVAAGVLIGLLAAAITLFLSWAGALEKAELAAYDWRIRQAATPASISKDIVLVEINETSIRDLAPFVIAIDFTFAEPDGTLGALIGGTAGECESR